MKKKPTISFCIPTFNRADRVFSCVNHILKCPSEDIEVVVSNNASTDNTLELLQTINDSRLKVLSNEKNIDVLNWPLAVSRASGQWAALMSDEDWVELDNLPYFLNLLTKADDDGIGAVLYDFPPIKRVWGEYVCHNVYDSLLQAHSSIHITAHILNMRYFKLDSNLENYNGFGFPISDTKLLISSPPVAEPQHEILLRIAAAHTVKLTDISLCSFGKDEVAKKTDRKINMITWDGMSTVYREILHKAFYAHLVKAMPLMQFNKNELLNRNAAITSFLLSLTLRANNWYMGMVYGYKHSYRPVALKLAHEHFKYCYEDAAAKMLEHIEKYIEYCAPHTDCEYFQSIPKYLRGILAGQAQMPLYPMSKPEWVMLGSYLFSAYIAFIGFWNGFDEVRFFKEDFDDFLEIQKTNEMYRLIKTDRDYDAVITFPDVTTFRAHYLRGCAYLAKNDFDNAIQSFESFLRIVENPKCVADIVVNAMWVQFTYYYMGYIYQKRGNYNKSVEYFSQCHKLTDKLLLGDKLVPKLLNLLVPIEEQI